MSALPIPPPFKAPFCKVNLSFFHHLLKIPNYVELKCFALILVETIGDKPKGSNEYYAEIPIDTFASAVGATKDFIYTALDELENNRHWIKTRKGLRGRTEYSIESRFIEEIEGAGKAARSARCMECKETGLFDTRFVMLPHAVLRKLGGCVRSAAYKCIMTVFMHTATWRDGYWHVEPKELSIDDFQGVADLEGREITNGLTEAIEAGVIGRQLRKGKPSLFWAIPDGLANLERRPLRLITPRNRSVEKTSNTEPPKTAENPIQPEKSSALESGSYLYAKCPHCKRFVYAEPVTEEELRVSQPEKPPRAGPGREKQTRKSKFVANLDKWAAKYGVK